MGRCIPWVYLCIYILWERVTRPFFLQRVRGRNNDRISDDEDLILVNPHLHNRIVLSVYVYIYMYYINIMNCIKYKLYNMLCYMCKHFKCLIYYHVTCKYL